MLNATGSVSALEGTAGAALHGLEVGSAEGARDVRRRLDALRAGQNVLVVGGGLTGFELFTEIVAHQSDLHVTLACRTPVGKNLSDRAAAWLERGLARKKVEVLTGACVREMHQHGVELATGRHLESHATVWAGGQRPTRLALEAGLAVAEDGRMLVDARYESTSHPDIYGVGDAAVLALPTGGTARMSCQVALPRGYSWLTRSVSAVAHCEPPAGGAVRVDQHQPGPPRRCDAADERRRPPSPGQSCGTTSSYLSKSSSHEARCSRFATRWTTTLSRHPHLERDLA